MKANPGEAKFVNQNAAAHVTGILLQKAHRHEGDTTFPIAAPARR